MTSHVLPLLSMSSARSQGRLRSASHRVAMSAWSTSWSLLRYRESGYARAIIRYRIIGQNSNRRDPFCLEHQRLARVIESLPSSPDPTSPSARSSEAFIGAVSNPSIEAMTRPLASASEEDQSRCRHHCWISHLHVVSVAFSSGSRPHIVIRFMRRGTCAL